MNRLPRMNWAAGGRTFRRSFLMILLLGLIALGVPGARPQADDLHFRALSAARDHLFDFATWEVNALADKAAIGILGVDQYMSAADQTRYVRDYLQLIQNIDILEKAVEQLYVDPAVTDPETASAGLRVLRDQLRAEQESKQALAEAIVQSQISESLVEYGFALGGQVLPPVSMRFTQLPTILIVSPRDHIERMGSYALEHGLTVDQMENIEGQVDHDLDVSSLIVPLGGLAVYPAMLIETSYLPNVINVGAHEWTHHYLAFSPLGFNYGKTPELYTINETVANIVGGEIGWAVMDRYYPDFAGDPPDYTPKPPPSPPQEAAPGQAPAFDFRAEMRATRIRADELLAEGKIDEAEQYMEDRRVLFVQHGYNIRKINQAYFAFYGAYADQPGATGSDPIGPALNDLRYYSSSLFDFVKTVRGMTSLVQIQAALEQARAEHQNGN